MYFTSYLEKGKSRLEPVMLKIYPLFLPERFKFFTHYSYFIYATVLAKTRLVGTKTEFNFIAAV